MPRVEYDLECRFFGPNQGELAVEFRLIVNNRGMARRRYSGMRLRLRMITRQDALSYRQEDLGRLDFPAKLLDVDLLAQDPPGQYFYYVEPGIRQTFCNPTKVPATATLILFHARLRSIADKEGGEADDENQFDEERVFEVPQQTRAQSATDPGPP